VDRFFGFFKFTNLLSLQLFQLIRYSTFILIGIAFAKLHLLTSDIGQYETLLLVSGMVSFFWVSGIISAMLSAYPKYNDAEKKVALFNTFLSLVSISIVTGILLFIFSKNLLAFINKQDGLGIIRLSIIYILFNCPSYLTEYILYLSDAKKGLLAYGIAFSVTTLLAAIIPAAMGYPLQYSLYGIIAVAALKLLFTVMLLGRYASFKMDYAIWIHGLKLSLPLMLSLFVSGSAEYIDGIIVKARFNNTAFAVYRYGAKELPILLVIANTFSTAMIPAIAENLEEGLASIKKKSLQLMHIFFPLTIVLMIFSPYLYRYIFNDSFVYSAFIFNIYLLLTIPRLMFPQTILTASQQSRFILISSVIEIVINVSLSLYWSKTFGLYGIALGTLAAYSFDKIFLVAVNAFVLKINPVRYIALAPLLLYSLLTVAAFGIGFAILMH
jgi:O-antigen/teichoic acid export membrane protein